MTITKTLRKLGWIGFVLFIFSCPATGMLTAIMPLPEHASGLFDVPFPAQVTLILAALGFILMMGGLVGSVVVRFMENAEVRKVGQSATAKVLAVHETGEWDNNSPVLRIKLEVHPPDGASFETVAEDVVPSFQMGMLEPGSKVPVKYDPRTKHVALEKAKRTKEEDF